MTFCQGSRFTAGNFDNNNKTGLQFQVSTLKHRTGNMANSEKMNDLDWLIVKIRQL